ncbi:MAG: isocitrate lyase/phosphoenolpyruvate mutase family protein [Saprospiraceae bacterium]|nr:isocitrate lyase/phosphoenolpyruvate mutase family protein [Saprospiraceae bacterium]
MNTKEKFEQFMGLHQSGNPILLYNAWDAGSAKALEEAGATAVATGSKPLALSQGYPDGEHIAFDQLLTTVQQIVSSISIPLSIDFEGGYAKADNVRLAENTSRLLETGIVGVNFEDQVIGVGGVFDIDTQKVRIATVRSAANKMEAPLFINARTDLFLQEKDKSKHAGLMDEAKKRAEAFAAAGADGFFAPGLDNLDLIVDLCQSVALPVNIIKLPSAPANQDLANAGVSRISYGPFAYLELMATFREKAEQLFSK